MYREKLFRVLGIWLTPDANQSTSLMAAFLSDALLLFNCSLTGSLTSFGTTALRSTAVWGVRQEAYILPCFGSFERKCLPSFSVRLFCFFLLLALLFVQNVSLSWWMYCAVTTYLPALVWIRCFYVWLGGRELKGGKKKDWINTVYHVTYVTVYCNSLLELIKI